MGISIEYNELNYMERAFAPIAAANKAAVLADTWGHLAPKRDVSYSGHMIFSLSEYGDTVLIQARFRGLSDSPWLFDKMMEFVNKKATKAGAIYRFDGVFRNYKLTGTTKRMV